jgi:hypothetical protein
MTPRPFAGGLLDVDGDGVLAGSLNFVVLIRKEQLQAMRPRGKAERQLTLSRCQGDMGRIFVDGNAHFRGGGIDK